MTQEQWTAVDRYITDRLVPEDPALDAALRASAAAGLPSINVSPAQGKLLMLLAQVQGARSILEIGTLGGYSTIWLARALAAGGRLVTLELDPGYAEVARANIARAGLGDVVEVRVGVALETLRQIVAESRGPFDLIFIDADKPKLPELLRVVAEARAARDAHRRRQRRPRGKNPRSRERRPPRSRDARPLRPARCRAPRQRDCDPDRR